MFNRVPTDTALMLVDDVVDNLPFIVRREVTDERDDARPI